MQLRFQGQPTVPDNHWTRNCLAAQDTDFFTVDASLVMLSSQPQTSSSMQCEEPHLFGTAFSLR